MNAAMKEQKSPGKAQDAVAMLTADHKKVKGLFEDFNNLKSHDDSGEAKADLVLQICQELTVHAQLEEEIFYPAIREAIEDEDLMDEAAVEHACAEELIAQLESMNPEDDLFDAKVTVLGEQIVHHVKEEEGDMFVKAKKSKVDTGALGEQMARRKTELMAEFAGSTDEDENDRQSEHLPSSHKKKLTNSGPRS